MLRSDLRATAPKAMPVIAGLLKGDVVFSSVAEAERAGYTQWTPKSKVASPAR